MDDDSKCLSMSECSALDKITEENNKKCITKKTCKEHIYEEGKFGKCVSKCPDNAP